VFIGVDEDDVVIVSSFVFGDSCKDLFAKLSYVVRGFEMAKGDKLRPAFTIAGFVFGASAAGFAISNAILSLLVILSRVLVQGYGGELRLSLDLSSEIAIVLCIGILILGFLLIRGSLMIWRLSVLGGAVNLASGIVLAAFSYAMIYVALRLLDQLYYLVLMETLLMSLFAMVSGIFGITALFEQLQRRFGRSYVGDVNTIRVAVGLPRGDVIQVGLSLDDKLSDLRKKVSEAEAGAVEGTSMIFRGRKVEDESQSLRALGVKEGDKITLV
jgi:hypothetical protein